MYLWRCFLPPKDIIRLWHGLSDLGHGIYIETAAEARQRAEGLRQLEAVLARRRAQQPDAHETPEEIDEIVRLVKEVRRRHATSRPL
jgi:hypothetical protein